MRVPRGPFAVEAGLTAECSRGPKRVPWGVGRAKRASPREDAAVGKTMTRTILAKPNGNRERDA